MLEKTTTPTDQQSETEKKSFSFGLLHGAARGKLSTRRRTVTLPPKPETETSATEQVPVAYKKAVPEGVAVPVENVPQPALAADRIDMDVNNYFSATTGRKQLLITASAAKSLTRLFSALTMEPGSGREVPVHIRTQVLDNLVRQAHILADKLCQTVMEEGRKAPVYLRAKLLQQAAEFLSEQWVRLGKLDADDLLEMTTKAFNGEVESLNQEVVDLFHQAGEFTPATELDISQARITEAVVRANWSLLRQVNHFDVNDYDPKPALSEGPQPFSYGRDPHGVSLDLTKIALGITRENALEIDHLDLATTWTQNSIDRAASLVRAEYRILTDRALRSSFKDELLSEAAINSVIGMYDKILERIHERARNGFIIVERNAIDAMAATAYTHYVPRKEPVSTNDSEPTASQDAKSNDPAQSAVAKDTVPSSTQSTSETESPSSADRPGSRFSFGRQSHA